MKYILCLLALAIIVFSRYDPIYAQRFSEKGVEKTSTIGEAGLFQQITNHYDYHSTQYWNQRYWVYEGYFNPKIGPIFLYICGEWVCSGPSQTQWLMVLAQRLQGLVLVLEHRFYGSSLPFGKESFTLENMKLLNSEQALRDLAYFQQEIIRNKLFGVTNNPWISVGGSYPGALSAWYRYKYPHLTIGAIASSAVVLAIEDFKDFDQQIYLSSQKSGDFCSIALNESNYRVQQILDASEGSAFSFKSQFAGGQKLTNNEFLFYWADAIVLTIQYGGRTSICNKLMDQTKDRQFNIIVQNAKSYAVYEYGSYYLRNETLTYLTQSASRPWYYQYCTEYGFFQTYSSQNPMRSKRLNLDFFRQFCSDAFGEGTWAKVQRKNTEYGGLDLKGSNIFFTNGIQDPWRWASLQQTNTSSLISRVIDCPNCAHCVDLRAPSQADAVALKKVRDEQFFTVSEWIQYYWQGLNKILDNEKLLQEE